MPKVGAVKVKPPSKGTLASYGLTEESWRAICERQGWQCPVCREPFGDRKLAIDHAHVAGFKARKVRRGRKVRVMPQEERVKHVRGILHSWCNRFVRRWMTLERSANILEYLKAHEERSRRWRSP